MKNILFIKTYVDLTEQNFNNNSEAPVPKSKTPKTTNQAHKGAAKNAKAKVTSSTESRSTMIDLLDLFIFYDSFLGVGLVWSIKYMSICNIFYQHQDIFDILHITNNIIKLKEPLLLY
jgi:hypothetical protein